ncbi:outer membrane beta-barrel protein [Sphingomonas naphthae]|uniref:Outer membrane beta-barrel protein n=1 Tax=Sphingomonas naphthae TaxID=1813468 RepID=A0ABY7TGM0_9SPHN|nr:outer membrane beta-barrel protein [Sphingomonas naphthae]WCT72377.1 outer membrane beta-barrel protein [Sphingomonas naphthae]
MTIRRLSPGLLAAAALVAPAAAQALPLVPSVYAGVEAGQGTRRAATSVGSNDKALDYGGFIGVELPSMPLGYLAVEGGIGKTNGKSLGTTGSSSATVLTEQDGRWNWSGTVRAGINAIPGLAVYGIAGYGAERAKITTTLAATGASTERSKSFDGLIYGAGVRYKFGTWTGARVEYRKRTTNGRYDPAQMMGGVYVGF